MSTDNAARFYWGKLDKAIAIFEAGNLEKAADICLQLCNEMRCPRFTQIEAWMLHADCNPDNYWFAKGSLDRALEICTACKSDASSKTAGPEDFAEPEKVKDTVSGMLRDRLVQYTEHWKKEGRSPPPSMDEWYEIMDAQEPGEGEEWLEAVVDENGEMIGGPVPDWPFEVPTVDASPPVSVAPKDT